MGSHVRLATDGDLDRIAELTAAQRDRLAGWAPLWWRPSAAAAQIHPLWLEHLVRSDAAVARVVEDDGLVVGCAFSNRQAGQWSVDDVALHADEHWPGAGVALLTGVTERPALTCVPAADTARAAAAPAAGLVHVSSYWIGPTVTGDPALPPPPAGGGGAVPPAPPHTFGGALDPGAAGALAFGDGRGGVVVGSRSLDAPPVYDPGGSVCVVDRVAGDDRAWALHTAQAAAGARGDVLLAVVVGVDDHDLATLSEAAGCTRTVDVYAWP